MKNFISVLIALLFLLRCTSNVKKEQSEGVTINSTITCNEKGCIGTYIGPEFVKNEDVAHQFSNKMSKSVGDKLKELYQAKNYVRVDFDNIHMSTKGMGTGNVVYQLEIPFVVVNNSCEAFTSFDHVGGWNHTPALEERKQQLSSALILGDTLNISKLKTTKEGLQEYWIQWRNNDLQEKCY